MLPNSKRAEKLDDLNKPVLPRKSRQPNYSILQFVSGHKKKSDADEPFYSIIVKEHIKAIFFGTIDAVYYALKERLEERIFIIFSNVEQLLFKSINGESYQKEYDDFESVYADHVEIMESSCLNLWNQFILVIL